MALKITESDRDRLRREILTRGNDALVVERAVRDFGWTKSDARKLVREIRAEFAARAEIEPRGELGEAVVRLNALFDSALRDGNFRAALDAQKELHKLVALYDRVVERGANAVDEEKARTRAILEPVVDGGREYDLDDLARVVVGKLVEARRNVK